MGAPQKLEHLQRFYQATHLENLRIFRNFPKFDGKFSQIVKEQENDHKFYCVRGFWGPIHPMLAAYDDFSIIFLLRPLLFPQNVETCLRAACTVMVIRGYGPRTLERISIFSKKLSNSSSLFSKISKYTGILLQAS